LEQVTAPLPFPITEVLTSYRSPDAKVQVWGAPSLDGLPLRAKVWSSGISPSRTQAPWVTAPVGFHLSATATKAGKETAHWRDIPGHMVGSTERTGPVRRQSRAWCGGVTGIWVWPAHPHLQSRRSLTCIRGFQRLLLCLVWPIVALSMFSFSAPLGAAPILCRSG
jgi:hypothetical protein